MGFPSEQKEKFYHKDHLKGKGLKSMDCQLQKQSWEGKHSIGHLVNNTVVSAYSIRWALDPSGDYFINCITV